MQIKNILFDLDGTLTDPVEGIVKCYLYSLARLNHPAPPREKLTTFIGPPIRQTFAEILQSADESLIERAVAIYRERFSSIGLYENYVYDGVPEMLVDLRTLGCDLFVATSKPQVYAEKVLVHFSLEEFFVEVHGNELSGRLDDKAELVRELMARHRLRPAETIMAGDRRHDVVAAKKNGVRSLGVTYGYGSEEELVSAGADYLADVPEAVTALIKRENHAARQSS